MSGRAFKDMTVICGPCEDLITHQQDVADVFRLHGGRLDKVRVIAAGIAEDIEVLSVFIQQHTAVICPECSSVCCINRHSYHTFDDIVFIYALGEQIPLHTPGLDDSGPCQFLGKLGCTVPRPLRPYRCNWYFCLPLLARITESGRAQHYRLFINLLQKLTGERQRLMEEYVSEVRGRGVPNMNKT
jgi:hypothetical protein